MATKIRLSRRGRKKNPFYHIVVVDARKKRDGKIIEQLGIYNPMTNPASINLEFDRALYWLQVGAQPTHTCRAILSYKGVLLKKHLLEGVNKGAFDNKIAEQKFKEWITNQENKIQKKKDSLAEKYDNKRKEQLEKESAINLERAKKLAAEKAKELEIEIPKTEDENVNTEPQEKKSEEVKDEKKENDNTETKESKSKEIKDEKKENVSAKTQEKNTAEAKDEKKKK